MLGRCLSRTDCQIPRPEILKCQLAAAPFAMLLKFADCQRVAAELGGIRFVGDDADFFRKHIIRCCGRKQYRLLLILCFEHPFRKQKLVFFCFEFRLFQQLFHFAAPVMVNADHNRRPVDLRQVRFTQDLRADAVVNRFEVCFCFNCRFDFSRTWMVRNDDCRFFHGAAGLGERIRIMFERRSFRFVLFPDIQTTVRINFDPVPGGVLSDADAFMNHSVELQ